MGICVRKALESDVPTIVGNWEELAQGNMRLSPKACKLKTNAAGIYRKYLKKQIKAKGTVVLVATVSGKVVAHIMANVEKIPPVYVIGREGFVSELFVKKEFREKGVGTKLLMAVQAWAKRKGMRQLSLTTNVKNGRARGVYLAFGMEELFVKMIKLL